MLTLTALGIRYRLIHIHSGKFLAAKPSAPGAADSNPDESEGAGAADFAAGMAPACAARLFTTPDQTLPSTLWTFVPLAQVIFAVFWCSLVHLMSSLESD